VRRKRIAPNGSDKQFFPELFHESIQALEEQQLVRKTPRGYVYSGTARPTEVVNLESISHQTVTVTCNGNLLETLTLNKAYEEAHEGAVLLHQGETYISEELNLQDFTVKVRQENVNYYTEALKTVDVAIKKTLKKKKSASKLA
jgi:DEAD/DEAH box helicase domain-containing protein